MTSHGRRCRDVAWVKGTGGHCAWFAVFFHTEERGDGWLRVAAGDLCDCAIVRQSAVFIYPFTSVPVHAFLVYNQMSRTHSLRG